MTVSDIPALGEDVPVYIRMAGPPDARTREKVRRTLSSDSFVEWLSPFKDAALPVSVSAVGPTSPERQSSPGPLEDLIPDDPFANLASPVSQPTAIEPPLSTPTPTPSPTRNRRGASVPTSPTSSQDHSFFLRRVTPAYQKPAIAPRPSLPSLSTLATIHVPIRKVPKGHVGAGLPAEPWSDGKWGLPSIKDSPTPTPRASTSFPIPPPQPPPPPPPETSDDDESSDDFDFGIELPPLNSDLQILWDRPEPPPLLLRTSTDTSSSSRSSSRPPRLSDESHRSSTSTAESDPLPSPVFPNFDVDCASPDADSELPWLSPVDRSQAYFDDLDFDCAPTPASSLYLAPPSQSDQDNDIPEPGTSAKTIRAVVQPSPSSLLLDDAFAPTRGRSRQRRSVRAVEGWIDSVSHDPIEYDAEPMDGGDSWSYSRSNGDSSRSWANGSGGGSRSRGNSGIGGSGGGGYNGNGFNGSSGGAGGGGGGDDRWNGNGKYSRPVVASMSDSSSSDEDDYGSDEPPTPSHGQMPTSSSYGHSLSRSPPNNTSAIHSSTSNNTTTPWHENSNSEEEDDVPLARSIPTALKAQKSIRKQVREEREERKRKRSDAMSKLEGGNTSLRPVKGRSRWQQQKQESLQTSSHTSSSVPRSSSQDAAMHSAVPARAQALSPGTAVGRSAAVSAPGQFTADELSKRLQAQMLSPPAMQQPVMSAPLAGARSRSRSVSQGNAHSRKASRDILPPLPTQIQTAPVGGGTRSTSHSRKPSKDVGGVSRDEGHGHGLRHQKSFHHTDREQHYLNVPSAQDASTAAGANNNNTGSVSAPPTNGPGVRRRAMSTTHRRAASPQTRISSEDRDVVPPLPLALPKKSEEIRRSGEEPQFKGLAPPAMPKAAPESMVVDDAIIKALVSNPKTKPSEIQELHRDKSTKLKKASAVGASAPMLPPTAGAAADGGPSSQRIFVGDLQRFQTVAIHPGTSVSSVIATLDASGAFAGWVGSGQWSLFEVFSDLGLERPLRPFEVVNDVLGSWNREKSGNVLMARMHESYAVMLGYGSHGKGRGVPEASPIKGGWVEWEAKRGRWNKRWLELREHGLWLAKKDSGKDEQLLCSLSNFDVYTLTATRQAASRAPKGYVFTVKSTDSVSFFEDKSDYMHVFSCREEEGEEWVRAIMMARSYILHQERNVIQSTSASASTPLTRGATISRSKTTGRKLVPTSNHTDAVFEPGTLLRQK